MRKIRDVLRLYFTAALSVRAIARSLGTSPSTVGEYLRRAKVAGLSWPVPESVDDAGLERRLFPAPPPSRAERPLPDWSEVHRELRRKSVTLALLWQEYKESHPEGLQYSWFCDQYRAWAGKLDLVMRQDHRAGEKLFVDYAGQTVPVVDRENGEERQAQIFVAVLGASSYTFAEATWTQTLPDWTASHVRAFDFIGGCPELVIPDNLRSGVSLAHRYEPDLNPTYHDLARHYGVAVLPARVRRPRDKAKAEVAVQVVERWILAALRHRTFFSLVELNAAIAELLERLNTRRFRKLPGSRRSQFEQLDRPALRPAARQPLRLRRVEGGAGGRRLPRGGRRALLLGPARARPPPARRPADGPHRRVPPPRAARRQPRPLAGQGAPHHRGGAQAREAPPDGRLDARPLHRLGREDRTGHRRLGRRRPRPAPSPAGPPLLPRAPAPGQVLRRRPPGSGRRPGAGRRQLQLPRRRIDPPPPARRGPRRAARTRRARRPRQHP